MADLAGKVVVVTAAAEVPDTTPVGWNSSTLQPEAAPGTPTALTDLLVAQPGVSSTEVSDALDRVGVLDAIRSLPEGLRTVLTATGAEPGGDPIAAHAFSGILEFWRLAVWLDDSEFTAWMGRVRLMHLGLIGGMLVVITDNVVGEFYGNSCGAVDHVITILQVPLFQAGAAAEVVHGVPGVTEIGQIVPGQPQLIV